MRRAARGDADGIGTGRRHRPGAGVARAARATDPARAVRARGDPQRRDGSGGHRAQRAGTDPDVREAAVPARDHSDRRRAAGGGGTPGSGRAAHRGVLLSLRRPAGRRARLDPWSAVHAGDRHRPHAGRAHAEARRAARRHRSAVARVRALVVRRQGADRGVPRGDRRARREQHPADLEHPRADGRRGGSRFAQPRGGRPCARRSHPCRRAHPGRRSAPRQRSPDPELRLARADGRRSSRSTAPRAICTAATTATGRPIPRSISPGCWRR